MVAHKSWHPAIQIIGPVQDGSVLSDHDLRSKCKLCGLTMALSPQDSSVPKTAVPSSALGCPQAILMERNDLMVDRNRFSRLYEVRARGLQLQPLWRTHAAAVS